MATKPAAAATRALVGLLQHSEQLSNPANQQPFLLHLHPRASRGWEDDVIAGPDRHPYSNVVPPVEAWTDGQDDPMLGRGLIAARGHEQSGAADPVGIELLDDDAIK